MAIRNIDDIPLKELFDEYSNLLFKRKDYGGFNFESNNNSEAEYWYNFLHRELESLESRYEQVKDNLKRLSPLGDYHYKLKLANIYQDIEKTKKMAEAVKAWFEKNDLNTPTIPTELEWEVMETGYAQVVKDHTNKRLSIVSNRFSTEGGKKEDVNFTIYALADEMRYRKKLGEFGTYADAYRYAEKYITINGKSVTKKQLENNWHKTKSSSTLLDDKYLPK